MGKPIITVMRGMHERHPGNVFLGIPHLFHGGERSSGS